MPNEPVELDLDNCAPPWWETLPDGRRAIRLEDAFNPDTSPQVLLILPERDGWLAVYKLELAASKIKDEVRAAERNEVHRGGGRVIVAPGEPAIHGPHNGP